MVSEKQNLRIICTFTKLNITNRKKQNHGAQQTIPCGREWHIDDSLKIGASWTDPGQLALMFVMRWVGPHTI